MTVSDRLAEAASAFLSALSDDARPGCVRPIDDEPERRNWFYWPGPRVGIALADLDIEEQGLAHQLVAEAVSAPTFAKVEAIIALERVLDEIEGRGGSRRGLSRDPFLYYLTIFGRPGRDQPWSFRFEGHHVSLHVTVARGDVTFAPSFLGANPAAVRNDGRVVLRPLGEEEDVARELLGSFDDEQLRRAVTDADAPDDILTANAPRVDDLPRGGLPFDGMRPEQRDLLETLVSVYVGRARPDIAGREMDRLRRDGLDQSEFAWAGGTDPGQGHYYRVSGPTFLAEYDNTQDDANHVHAVWRDADRDFGADLLRRHLAAEHTR